MVAYGSAGGRCVTTLRGQCVVRKTGIRPGKVAHGGRCVTILRGAYYTKARNRCKGYRDNLFDTIQHMWRHDSRQGAVYWPSQRQSGNTGPWHVRVLKETPSCGLVVAVNGGPRATRGAVVTRPRATRGAVVTSERWWIAGVGYLAHDSLTE